MTKPKINFFSGELTPFHMYCGMLIIQYRTEYFRILNSEDHIVDFDELDTFLLTKMEEYNTLITMLFQDFIIFGTQESVNHPDIEVEFIFSSNDFMYHDFQKFKNNVLNG